MGVWQILPLLKLLLLVHTIIAVDRVLDFGDYIVTTHDDVLQTIRITDSFKEKLDLSNLGLVGLDEHAFDSDLNKVLTLDLSNNWLTTIPQYVFSNLTNLEYMSLSGNNITGYLRNAFTGLPNLKYLSLSENNITCCLEKTFVGLRNLLHLNISNNNLTQLEDEYFAGLTDMAEILIDGNFISNISTGLFEYNYLRHKPIILDDEKILTKRNEDEKYNHFRVMVCFDPNLMIYTCRVKSVEIYNAPQLPDNCKGVEVNHAEGKLIFHNVAIKRFDENWYRLQNFSIRSIDLSVNFPNIQTDLSFLSNFPQNFDEVKMSNSECVYDFKINIVVQNKYLRTLRINNFCVAEIIPRAFAETNLMVLDFSYNYLRNLEFVTSLPSSLTDLDLSTNRISDIPPYTFAMHHQLVNLSLSENQIMTLSSQALNGLLSLKYLNLSFNPLKFSSMPFHDLRNLKYLSVAGIGISKIDKGLFTGLENIEVLDMADNALSEITRSTLYGLPDTLSTVILDRNKIVFLAKDSFIRIPKHTLSLDANPIEFIDTESFNLPTLQELRLNECGLHELNTWGNLKGLKRLILSNNRISTIKKGTIRNMGQLEILNLSHNKIERLNNSDLFGMRKLPKGVVLLDRMKIRYIYIHGGVFNNA